MGIKKSMNLWNKIYEELGESNQGARVCETLYVSGIVLDLGCGDFASANLLRTSREIYIVGLDFSEIALKNARENVKRQNVNLVNAIGQYLPFRDNTFNYVLCIETLIHFDEDYEKVLEEMFRASKENIIVTVNQEVLKL